jgi:hypothetical protein
MEKSVLGNRIRFTSSTVHKLKVMGALVGARGKAGQERRSQSRKVEKAVLSGGVVEVVLAARLFVVIAASE